MALKGSREGSRTTRCTEAGVYARDFVETVAEVLSQVLCGGSQAVEPQAGQNPKNKDEGNQFRAPGDQSRAAIDIIPDRAEQGRVGNQSKSPQQSGPRHHSRLGGARPSGLA